MMGTVFSLEEAGRFFCLREKETCYKEAFALFVIKWWLSVPSMLESVIIS